MRGTSTRVRMKEKRGIFLLDKACSLRLEWWEGSEKNLGGRSKYKQIREGPWERKVGWVHVIFLIRRTRYIEMNKCGIKSNIIF